MRKNTSAVVEAFLIGQPLRKSVSIWTDGNTIFSYDTAIVERRFNSRGKGSLWVNLTKYSTTTSAQQGSICARFNRYGLDYTAVDGVPMGAKSVGRKIITDLGTQLSTYRALETV